MPTHILKVLRVSINTNNFGLYEFYLVTSKGQVFRALANSLKCPKKDDMIEITNNLDKATTFDLVKLGYEAPEERDAKPTEKVMNQLFPKVYTLTMDVAVEDVSTFEALLDETIAAGRLQSYQVVAGGESRVKYDLNFLNLKDIFDTGYHWGREVNF